MGSVYIKQVLRISCSMDYLKSKSLTVVFQFQSFLLITVVKRYMYCDVFKLKYAKMLSEKTYLSQVRIIFTLEIVTDLF